MARREIKTVNIQGLGQVFDDDKKLALSILKAAQLEAAGGDLAALTFLIVDGVTLEELVLPKRQVGNRKPESSAVLEFCKRTWGKILKGELKPHWAGDEMKAEFNLLGLTCKSNLQDEVLTKD